MSCEFKGKPGTGAITAKSVKFSKLLDSESNVYLKKQSIIEIDGVKHYVTAIIGVETGNRMIKVTGKAVPV